MYRQLLRVSPTLLFTLLAGFGFAQHVHKEGETLPGGWKVYKIDGDPVWYDGSDLFDWKPLTTAQINAIGFDHSKKVTDNGFMSMSEAATPQGKATLQGRLQSNEIIVYPSYPTEGTEEHYRSRDDHRLMVPEPDGISRPADPLACYRVGTDGYWCRLTLERQGQRLVRYFYSTLEPRSLKDHGHQARCWNHFHTRRPAVVDIYQDVAIAQRPPERRMINQTTINIKEELTVNVQYFSITTVAPTVVREAPYRPEWTTFEGATPPVTTDFVVGNISLGNACRDCGWFSVITPVRGILPNLPLPPGYTPPLFGTPPNNPEQDFRSIIGGNSNSEPPPATGNRVRDVSGKG